MSKNGSTGSWNEERVELMTTLWSDGHSAGSIAREMGGFDSVDGGRCAVIGKLYRLGLIGSGEKPRHTLPRGRGHRRVRAGVPVPTWMATARRGDVMEYRPVPAARVKPLRQRPERIVIAEPQEAPQSLEKSIVEVAFRGECKWPTGDGPYTFCANPIAPGSVYCPWHRSVAYTKATQRDVDRIASRAMGGITGEGKSTVMEA